MKVLQRGGAVADHFVELRELERGLGELLGGRRRLSEVLSAAGAGPEGDPRPERSRARRYTTPPSRPHGPSWPAELFEAYGRWLGSTEPSAHRSALGRCLGLISDELQDVLRCRHALGMNSREIAEHLVRPHAEIEELTCKLHGFLAGCIRLRLSRLQERSQHCG